MSLYRPCAFVVSGFSRLRLFLNLLLVTCLATLATTLPAQTARLNGAIATLGSGFQSPRGVAVDGSGNVFVADTLNNAVKEIVATGGYTTINTLGDGQFSAPSGVAVDRSGNVFVADSNHEVVKEIMAAGGYTTVITLRSGFQSIVGVAVDGSGNVFVADSSATSVTEIVAATGYTTVSTLGSGLSAPSGVAVDGSGNVFVADAGHGAVKEIVAAGNYATISTLSSGLVHPYGVTVDGSGNVFVTDNLTNAVEELVAASGYTTALTLSNGSFTPFGVAVDGSGNIFVADNGNNVVQEIMPGGGISGSVNVGSTSISNVTLSFTFDTTGTLGSTAVLTKGAPGLDFQNAGGGSCTAGQAYNAGATCTVNVSFKPTASGTRYGGVDLLNSTGLLLATGYVQGTGVGPQVTFANTTTGSYLPSAQTILGSGFQDPWGLAVDGSGNVFVADTNNNTIKEIVAVGGYQTIRSLGFNLYLPNAVAVDGAGNLFVAQNDVLKEIVAAGGYTTTLDLARGFREIVGVAVDGNGNVFVTDLGTNLVQELMAASGYTTRRTLGHGFTSPSAVAVDASGNVFVTDLYSGSLQEILAATGYTTVNILATGMGPYGVAVDGNGNVFVADLAYYQIREFLAQGGYTTVHTLQGGFAFPMGVAVDGNGNVFVTDSYPTTNLVEKLDYADPPSLSFALTTVGSQSSDSPQSVSVSNIGNAGLTFPTPPVGSNPGLPSGFRLDNATTCPQGSTSSAAATLAAGSSCAYALDFVPTAGGPISGSLVLTDNNLNAPGPSFINQAVPLSGTAQQIQTITFTNPGAQVQGTNLILQATSNTVNPISFTSTTPQVCTVSGKVATLLTAGSCSITAQQAAAPYFLAGSANQTFTVNPPFLITATPHFATVTAPATDPVVLQLTPLNGFTGTVSIACSGLPTGAKCPGLPVTEKLNGKSTVTYNSGVQFAKGTPAGSYAITFTAISGTTQNTATVTIQLH